MMAKQTKLNSSATLLLILLPLASIAPPLYAQALNPAQLDAGEESPVVRSLRRESPLFRSTPPPGSLAAAFQKPIGELAKDDEQEVEPVVLGREKWNEGENGTDPAEKTTATPIKELPPIETEQQNPGKGLLPIKPPFPPPAISLHRNFDGKLVLKPRKLGYEKDFPYQLLNTAGKRLAYVDVDGMRAINPLDFRDRTVTILGKLETVEEGSKDLIIRARLIRGRE